MMFLMYKIYSYLAGSQKDCGFVLIMGDHIRLLLPFNLRILFVLPPFLGLVGLLPLNTQSPRHAQITILRT